MGLRPVWSRTPLPSSNETLLLELRRRIETPQCLWGACSVMVILDYVKSGDELR
jgi:hypothetical protein